jgi:hypothetical protein
LKGLVTPPEGGPGTKPPPPDKQQGIGGIFQTLGISSWKDFFTRIGLLILVSILFIVGAIAIVRAFMKANNISVKPVPA